MKKILALVALIIGFTTPAHADFMYNPPAWGTGFYTNDSQDEFGNVTHLPYAEISNSIITLYPGSLNYPTPGVSATWIGLGNSSIPCDGSHQNMLTGNGVGLKLCNGTNFDTLVSGTTAALIQATEAADVASLTTAVNSKVATSIFNTQVSSLTTAVNGKFSQPTGTTAQYLRGDGSIQTFPAIPPALNFSFANPTRTLNTAFQLTATTGTLSTYMVDIGINSLLTTVQGTVILEYADNSGMSTNVVQVGAATSGIGGVLNIANTSTVTVSGMIPAGKWVRLRTANIAGTPTFTFRSAQEVTF